MKRIVSLLLAAIMLVSAIPMAYAADVDYNQGTTITLYGVGDDTYTITVPAQLSPGQSGTVTAQGTWPSSQTLNVTAPSSVDTTHNGQTLTVPITFDGISQVGSDTSTLNVTETVSVGNVTALFGTWTGILYYNVSMDGLTYLGTVSADNTITLDTAPAAGTYTLRYANADGALENCADICSLEVTDPATAVSYDDLIAENCAPVEATTIAVYNESNEKVGDIALGNLATNLGTKLYSFGALADTHIGYTNAITKTENALSYLTETENVAFTCIPGDLTESADDTTISALINSISTASPNTPVYLSTGNHDADNSYYDTSGITVSDVLEDKTGNPLYYSFTYGNDVFIMVGLDSDNEGDIFASGELEWLYNTLETNKDKRCFVFQHVFPNDEGCGNPNNIYDYDIWGGTEQISFESMMEHYTNALFFHGHSHALFELQSISDMANYDNIRGSHSIHIPSVTKPRDGNSNFVDGSEGYVVDVYENGIILRGMDFMNNQLLPIAQYELITQNTVSSSKVVVPTQIEWQAGVKIDKSTGVDGAEEQYAASQHFQIDDDKAKTLYVKTAWYNSGTACYYDANGNYLGYIQLYSSVDENSENYVEGNYTYPQVVTIPHMEGAATFRLRMWFPSFELQYTYITLCNEFLP